MKYSAGVDLGGTNIAVGLVSEAGEIIAKTSTPTIRGRSYQLIVKDMADCIKKLIAGCDLKEEKLIEIGIGSPGVVNHTTGCIVRSCNLDFCNTPLVAELSKYFNVDINLENDANCAAFAESKVGAGKGSYCSVTVTIGTGVGGGIIIDEKVFSGFNQAGGELGHMVIEPNGPMCTCGRRGCFEALSSATALIHQMIDSAKINPNSLVHILVSGDLDKIEAKTVFDAAHAGDIAANEVLTKYFHYLGMGITNLINIFQPNVLIIGGGVCSQGEYLLSPIREYVSREVFTRNFVEFGLPQTEIKIAKLGNDAGVIGAGLLRLGVNK